ncbi:MAG TPA: hypothetical protein PKD28_03855 [Candidatus Saccharibacteria bacterium]|nr:hypothetical protein [Candidatus Saccharibacteria bacterium]
MFSTDTAPLTIGKTVAEEAAFAHAIADHLAADIVAHCGPFARLFKRKLELYVLAPNCHISNDHLRGSECRQSRISLPQDDADRREMTRGIVAQTIPAIISQHNLPFTEYSVEVTEVGVYQYDGSRDRYGFDFGLRITLNR